MRVTSLTKHTLAFRKEEKAMISDGWESIDHGEHNRLWELDRGCRRGWEIVDVRKSVGPLRVWVKCKDVRGQ